MNGDLRRKEERMNVQIFGTKKCNGTKKSQRYFKERGINAMINEDCKDKNALALVMYISEDEREEKLLANQQVIKTPIVRNGKQATLGYAPEVWKGWRSY